MTGIMSRALAGGAPVGALRADIRRDRGTAMRLRRAGVATALVGMASMAVVTLYQTGILRHLPDPPRGNFDSDRINASDEAFGYGMPDAPLAIAAHAADLGLAAAGPADRAERVPWVPLAQAALNAGKAAVAAKYLFHQMPKVDKAWCPYCILDALTHFAALALILPEAGRAAAVLGRRLSPAAAPSPGRRPRRAG